MVGELEANHYWPARRAYLFFVSRCRHVVKREHWNKTKNCFQTFLNFKLELLLIEHKNCYTKFLNFESKLIFIEQHVNKKLLIFSN